LQSKNNHTHLFAKSLISKIKAPNRHLFKMFYKIVFVCTFAKPNQPQRLVCDTIDIKTESAKAPYQKIQTGNYLLEQEFTSGHKKMYIHEKGKNIYNDLQYSHCFLFGYRPIVNVKGL
jgi:hypothetical protein